MKKGGTGGANTNKNGLKFERRIDIKTAQSGNAQDLRFTP